MLLPTKITIHSLARSHDGGSVTFRASDEDCWLCQIELIQRMFTEETNPKWRIPGGLYFDGKLIDVRSAEEARLLELLRGAVVVPTLSILARDHRGNKVEEWEPAPSEVPDTTSAIACDILNVVSEVIEFVASQEYVSLAARMRKR